MINKKNSGILLAAVLAALAHTLLYLPFFPLSSQVENYETRFLDAWFELRGTRSPPPEIVLVSMDEDSYNALDIPLNQPWPRAVHARLLLRLAELGARRVVFDVLFLGEGADPDADRELAEAIGALPVVLGADFGVANDSQSVKYYQLRPYEMFQEKAEKLGIVGFAEDHGSVRRFLTKLPRHNEDLITLSQAALGTEHLGDAVPGERDFINFYGPSGVIKNFPYYQVVDQDIPERTEELLRQSFRDKIVFVGLYMKTGLGASQKDSYHTAFAQSERRFGVEIHANAAGNLLDKSWIRRSPRYVEAAVLGLLTFVISAVIFISRPLAGGIVWVVYLSAWALIAYQSFKAGFFVPGAFLFTLLLPILYLGSTLAYYIITRMAQKRFQRAFELYISPEMAARLSEDRDSLKLGGEKVVATALFTDIAGFTDVSEKLEAEEVAKMLNSYFTEVMDEIFHNQGTLIKFIGDAVFALWGSPIKIQDHASRACMTALGISRAVEKFNASGRFPALHTRIGLNTGKMVVGNLGSERRFDFTAVGDSVNLAARVEGINKYFGTSILITEAVKEQTGDEFNTLFVGRINVVGKKLPVAIYVLLEKEVSLPEAGWQAAVGHFTEQRWEEARGAFSAIRDSEPLLAKAASFYLKQLDILSQEGAPAGWQGELVFSQK